MGKKTGVLVFVRSGIVLASAVEEPGDSITVGRLIYNPSYGCAWRREGRTCEFISGGQ